MHLSSQIILTHIPWFEWLRTLPVLSYSVGILFDFVFEDR